jgi:hypothetical protein
VRSLLVLGLALLGSVSLASAETAPDPIPERRIEAVVTGGIAWIGSDDLDIVGTMAAETTWLDGGAYLSLDARTAIERAVSGLTFAVQSLDYRIEAGARMPPGDVMGVSLGLFVGQRGRENVDRAGEPWLRYVGLGIGSGHRDGDALGHGRFAGSFEAGAVVHEVEVDADAILRGNVRFPLVRSREGRCIVELEAAAEALATAHSLDVDWSAGARVRVDRSGETSLYARYVREESAVGIQAEGAMVGLDFSGTNAAGGREPARVGGTIAGGYGEERGAGRFALAFATPDLLGPLFIAAEVEGNILTGEDTGELYYFYHVGLERPFGALLGAADYYHRSNHTLAEPNAVVTSYDVLEVGIDTPGYRDPLLPDVGRAGTLEGRLRAGYVLDTSFDEDTRWHARGSVRWFLPFRTRSLAPYARAAAETGDVDRREYALGARIAPGIDVEVEYRSDEAYFGSDEDALLLMAAAVF